MLFTTYELTRKLVRSKKLSNLQFTALVALIDSADTRTGHVRMTRKLLAERARMSKRRVITTVHELEQLGYIRLHVRSRQRHPDVFDIAPTVQLLAQTCTPCTPGDFRDAHRAPLGRSDMHAVHPIEDTETKKIIREEYMATTSAQSRTLDLFDDSRYQHTTSQHATVTNGNGECDSRPSDSGMASEFNAAASGAVHSVIGSARDEKPAPVAAHLSSAANTATAQTQTTQTPPCSAAPPRDPDRRPDSEMPIAGPPLAQERVSDSPTSQAPSSSPKPRKTEIASGTINQLVAAYGELFFQSFGRQPVNAAKNRAVARKILAEVPLDDALGAVRNAFADPWFVAHSGELTTVLGCLNKYLRAAGVARPIASNAPRRIDPGY